MKQASGREQIYAGYAAYSKSGTAQRSAKLKVGAIIDKVCPVEAIKGKSVNQLVAFGIDLCMIEKQAIKDNNPELRDKARSYVDAAAQAIDYIQAKKG